MVGLYTLPLSSIGPTPTLAMGGHHPPSLTSWQLLEHPPTLHTQLLAHTHIQLPAQLEGEGGVYYGGRIFDHDHIGNAHIDHDYIGNAHIGNGQKSDKLVMAILVTPILVTPKLATLKLKIYLTPKIAFLPK